MDSNAEKKAYGNLSASSLVALKAELLTKQAQVEKARAAGIKVIQRGGENKKVKEPEKKNSGVELRAKKDEEAKREEEPSLEKSRIALEEKAKLYEKLSKDKTLLEEDTITEESSAYLVDFQQKVVKETLEERRARLAKEKARKQQILGGESEEDVAPSNPDEEWVDFVDSLGRTRRCLRKDLSYYQQQDEELYKGKSESSATYSNFVKPSQEGESSENTENLGMDEEARKKQRLAWEEEEAVNSMKSNIHYQDILYQEARQHGVGFYSFSRNEEERAKQMEELERLRKQTEAARAQVAQSAVQKHNALEARLQKVRDRKRAKLGLAPLKEPILPPVAVPSEPPAPEIKETDKTKEAEEKLRLSLSRSLPQTAKVRPWDIGKEGVPEKKEVMTQEAWVEKRREERVNEFAPPSSLYGAAAKPPKATPAKEQAAFTDDSIAAGLAFFKQKDYNEAQDAAEKRIDSSDDEDEELLPPGEVDYYSRSNQASSSRPGPSRGVSIPPPTSMDYYAESSKRLKTNGKRVDVRESFAMGLAQQREAK